MKEIIKTCGNCKYDYNDLCGKTHRECDGHGSGFVPSNYAKLRNAIEWRLEEYEKDIASPEFKDWGETSKYITYNLRNLCVALLASVDEDDNFIKQEEK